MPAITQAHNARMEQPIVTKEAIFEVQWMSMPIDPSKTPKKGKAMSTKRGDKISRVPISFRIVVLQRRGLQPIELHDDCSS
jgi:hypothetical protein